MGAAQKNKKKIAIPWVTLLNNSMEHYTPLSN